MSDRSPIDDVVLPAVVAPVTPAPSPDPTTPTNPDRITTEYQPKRLPDSELNSPESWQELARFVRSVHDGLFDRREPPESQRGQEFFTPTLGLPSTPARLRHFCALIKLGNENVNEFLLIGDVYSLLYQTWMRLGYEANGLLEKQNQALQNRNTFPDNAPEWLAWNERATEVGELHLFIRDEIKKAQEHYFVGELGQFQFWDSNLRITEELEKALLERREEDVNAEMREILLALIKACTELAKQKDLPFEKLTPGELAAVATEEAPAEHVTAAPAINTATVAPVASGPAGPETAESGGDSEASKDEPKPPTPEDEEAIRRRTQQEPLDLTAAGRAKRFKQVLKLEEEAARYTGILLSQIEDLYQGQVKLADSPVLWGLAQGEVNAWLLGRFGPFGLERLQQDVGLQQQITIELVARLTAEGSDFSKGVNQRIDQYVASLPASERPAFIKLVEDTSAPGSLASFAKQLQAQIFTPNSPLADIAAAAKFVRENPGTMLSAALERLANQPGQTLLDKATLGISQTNLENLAHTLVFLGYKPALLDVLNQSTFQQLTNVHLTADQYRDIIGYLKLYSVSIRQNYAREKVQLNFATFDFNVLEELAQQNGLIDQDRRNIDDILTMMRLVQAVDAPNARGTEFVARIIGTAPSSEADAEEGEDLSPEEAAQISAEVARSREVFTAKYRAYQQALLQSLTEEQIIAYAEFKGVEVAVARTMPISMQDLVEIGVDSGDPSGLIPTYDGGEYSPIFGADAGQGRLGFRASPPRSGGLRGTVQNLLQAARNRRGAGGAAGAATQAGKNVANGLLDRAREGLLNAAGAALGLGPIGTAYVKIPKPIRDMIELGGLLGLVGEGLMLVVSAGARLGAAIGSLFGPAGTLLGIPIGFGLEQMFKNFGSNALKGLGLGGESGASTAGTAAHTAANTFGTPASSAFTRGAHLAAPAKAVTTQTLGAKVLAAGTKVVTGNILTTSLLVTLGGTAAATIYSMTAISGAFIANFPLPDKSTDPNSNEKISKYLSLEKRVTLPAGCDQTTLKCPNPEPGQTYEVTYHIILTSKGNYTVSITDALDTLTTRYSKKAYEDKGLEVPEAKVRIRSIKNNGVTCAAPTPGPTGSPSPTPGPSGDNTLPGLSSDANNGCNVIEAGEKVDIIYTETFDSSYNDSSNTNRFKATFYYIDGTNTGNDTVETAKSFCIGECAMAAGCWPASGKISQIPFTQFCGTSKLGLPLQCSHHAMDAFDIAMVDGTNVYAPFAGKACVGHGDKGWGEPYLTLTASEGDFIFGHLSESLLGDDCKDVEAGELIALSDNSGHDSKGRPTSTGPHLHFGMARGSAFAGFGPPSDLVFLMPPTDQGTPADKITEEMAELKNQDVTSCYDTQK